MLLTIQNEFLQLGIETLGAQMMHLKSASGREYLWQGDPETWPDRAPVLFPFIARLTDNSYMYRGKTYPMTIHGFASSSEFVPVEHTAEKLVLELCANEETRRRYPFDFRFQVCWELKENAAEICFRVENQSAETMPFGVGGHPGFRIGAEEGDDFGDYFLEFSTPCRPDRVGFTPQIFLSGKDEAYPLESGTLLPLSHGMFEEDAVILKNMARQVTLRSKKHRRTVTVSYPDFPYLGIWHWPHSEVPYVCIEPWTSLPSRQDVVEEFTCKSDMIQLRPGKIQEFCWSIAVSE